MAEVASPSARDRIGAGVDWLAATTVDRIAIDLRALAALRIALGSLLLVDLLLRTRNFVVFYTDRGIYPLSYLNPALAEPYSVHAFDGSVEFQALLFVIAGLFALSLLLGYHTRTATVVSWFMLLSLHTRNPLVLNSGDVLFRMLLFWGIFLPLGERWSIDARRVDRDRIAVASLGTLALLVQIVLVYTINAVHKLRSEEWLDGSAVPTIMHLEHFTVYLGPYLAEVQPLLRLVTWVWLTLVVVVAPLLLLLTGWPRALLASAFAGMHLGMATTMAIGIFPFVSVSGLLVFYHRPIWDRLEAVATERGLSPLLGATLDRLDRVAPLPRLRTRPRDLLPDGVPDPGPTVASIVLVLMIPSVVLSGAASVDYAEVPDPGDELLDHTEMDQHWQMFAPNPADTSRWYVGVGNLTDGTRVDPYLGGAPSFDRPPNPATTVRTARWRKAIVYTQYHSLSHTPNHLGNFLCEHWNRTHDTQLATVSIYAMQREVGPDGPETPIERDVVVDHYDCSEDRLQA
ncbi:HTTM domain protein [Salinarchaeum sp. Harcht-Bsk1]|uniref:HTTM domain-containing protein n=1 Tax=Salinarchaeum sp. Harcht-Bsk1 TaxID=1333523 RepID=UPI00034240BB|nr:HTTM domain-containing protein [Salinarchaeum sp. Harcht-Bsk1]AGN00014.1 HTTM domain protein [Salinarchaeum sp. Harcht-Bsk1]